MSFSARLSELVVDHSRLIIAIVIVSSLLIGSGVLAVERTSSLARYQTDTPAGETQRTLDNTFNSDAENKTQAVVIIRGENVLTKESLVAQLDLQREIQTNQTINDSLTAPPTGIATVIATTGLLEQRSERLRRDANEFNETVRPLADRLNRTRELQHEYFLLNRSYEEERIDQKTYENRSEELQQQLNRAMYPSNANLTAEQRTEFRDISRQVRDLQRQADQLESQLQEGEINQSEYLSQIAELEKKGKRLYTQELPANVYEERYMELRQREAELRELQAALVGPSTDENKLPPLSQQRDQLASMNQSQIDSVVTRVLNGGSENDRPFAFMPLGYTPGNTTANATMIAVTTKSEGPTLPGTASTAVIETQTALRDTVENQYSHGNTSAFVFGNGLVNEEIDNSMIDSLTILLPLSFLYVLIVLVLLYRDPIDIGIGLFGIGLVLLWTFGFMGWIGIDLSPTIVVIPILLVGLAIDYSNHAFMRYRETRGDNSQNSDAGIRGSMLLGLTGLLTALLWVTLTTAIGFSANYFSPAPPLQDLGIVAPAGIIFAFLIFVTIVPALKVEADDFLERRGHERRAPPIGTGGDRLRPVLMVGVRLARQAPGRVILVAFLLATAGLVGAAQLNTSFQQEDFVAEEPQAWMTELPEPLAPAEYNTRDNLDYLYTHFIHQNTETEFLIQGDVSDPGTLARINRAEHRAIDSEIVANRTHGEPAVTTPLTVMETVARSNESFNQTFTDADIDDDGVLDKNITAVYDELFRVAPELAGSVIARDNGEYSAVRLTIASEGAYTNEEISTEMRLIEDELQAEGVSTSLGGQPVLFTQVQNQILETAVNSFYYSFLLIAGILLVGYRLYHGSGSLGLVTFIPVLFTLAWILGTMYLLDIALNVLTAMIVSITLGLGVDYTIHVSERFSEEFEGKDTFATALEKSVTGTGGALLGSMLTTAGAFAILYFGFLPPMANFGLISALTVFYAFLASVLVLPSALVLRYVLPQVLRHWYRTRSWTKTGKHS
jgi:hydrophobe/amphiphile efflux-3 (HAE3) family protein